MGTIINYDHQDKIKTCFVSCDCKTEVLCIEYDHDTNMAEVALYEHKSYLTGKMSWLNKLRYCWKILCTGRPYCDQLVLTNKSLRELRVFLLSLDL